jgi:UDP-N-acetylmuramate dehydrogenase
MGGFENLALIPGTVGASPIQNIGAYGVEIEKFIKSVEFLDTTSMCIDSMTNSQCQFGYRDSVFKQQSLNQRIITHVTFQLPKQYKLETSYGPLAELDSPNSRDIFNKVVAIRQSKLPDPLVLGNAGSFFKNPVISNTQFQHIQATYPNAPSYRLNDAELKVPAAWLIDTLGFKGKQVGNIRCHSKQPLVLVNTGGGTGADLLALARNIRNAVQDNFAILLDNEVRLMGKQGLIKL